MSFYFLATPYSHPKHDGRLYRHWQTCKLLGALLEKKMLVFSPIAHSHLAADLHGLPTDCDFWEYFNFQYLHMAEGLMVGMFEGWEDSQGIKRELDKADELRLSVMFIDPRNYGIDPKLPPHLK